MYCSVHCASLSYITYCNVMCIYILGCRGLTHFTFSAVDATAYKAIICIQFIRACYVGTTIVLTRILHGSC